MNLTAWVLVLLFVSPQGMPQSAVPIYFGNKDLCEAARQHYAKVPFVAADCFVAGLDYIPTTPRDLRPKP